MKAIITVCLVALSGFFPAAAQELLDDIQGRWEVLKYNGETRAEDKAGQIDFLDDGTFMSADAYLGHTKGLYRTDETRSVLIIEVDGKLSEWKVSQKDGKFRLNKIVEGKERKVFLLLKKLGQPG